MLTKILIKITKIFLTSLSSKTQISIIKLDIRIKIKFFNQDQGNLNQILIINCQLLIIQIKTVKMFSKTTWEVTWEITWEITWETTWEITWETTWGTTWEITWGTTWGTT